MRILQDETGFGARALGMGGAYTAVADDYSSIFWNPAGLATLDNSEFYGEISHLNFNNQATFSGSLTDDTENFTRLRSLGYAFPLATTRGSFVIGVGYNRVKDFDQNLLFSGFNTQSNDFGIDIEVDGQTETFLFDRNVQQTESVRDEGGLDQWTAGFGVAMSPNFYAGLTAIVWNGNSDYEFRFDQVDTENNFETFPADFDSYSLFRTIQTDYTGVSLKLGALLEPAKGFKVGASLGLPTTFTVDEIYAANDNVVFDDGSDDPFDEPTSEFRYKVKTPFSFDSGVSFSNGQFMLAGGLRYRDWSNVEFDADDEDLFDDDLRSLLDENEVIRTEYEATVQYSVGGELNMPGLNSKVRLGYTSIPSPLKNPVADFDKEYLTAGVSFLVDEFVSLDVSFLRGSWNQESEDEFTPGGTLEEITANQILLGLKYQF